MEVRSSVLRLLRRLKKSKRSKNQWLKEYRIRERLEQAFMFSNLDEKDKDIVVDAMEEACFDKGETVI